jgi:hypothetical protein
MSHKNLNADLSRKGHGRSILSTIKMCQYKSYIYLGSVYVRLDLIISLIRITVHRSGLVILSLRAIFLPRSRRQ